MNPITPLRSAALCVLLLTPAAFAQDAQPSNLGGTSLCLSQKNTVTLGVDGAGKMDLKGLADRAYAQIKKAFQAQGVKFHEAAGCSDSASAFYLVFNATATAKNGERAFLVQGSVSDWTGAKYKTYVDIWSGAHYGFDSGEDDAMAKSLLDEGQGLLSDFVSDWKAANPK